jgi:hypothetical protein
MVNFHQIGCTTNPIFLQPRYGCGALGPGSKPRSLNQRQLRCPNAVMVVILVLLRLGFCLEGDWPGFTAKVMVSALSFFGLGFAFLTRFFFCQVWRTSEDLLVDPKHSSHRYFLGRVFGLTMIQSALLVAVFQFGEMDMVSAFGISCGFLAVSVLVLPLVSTKAANMGIAMRHVFMSVVCAVATFRMLLGTEGVPVVDATG